MLLEQVGQLGLRLLQLSGARERLALEEAGVVRGSALVVAVDHLAKRLERLVGAAGSERALSAAQHVVRCVFVAHLASVDDDGAGRSPAGGDQRGEEEDASHCITWTWASFGGSKRNRESGSPELTFASLNTS